MNLKFEIYSQEKYEAVHNQVNSDQIGMQTGKEVNRQRGQQAVQLSETKKLNVQGDTGFWKIHSAKNSRLNVAFRL